MKISGQESTKQWQLSPRALIQPPKEPNKTVSSSNHPPASSATSTSTSSTTNSKGTLFKAIFDYSAKQADELSLKVEFLSEKDLTRLTTFQKGEFYTVSEMCVDGWYKGQSLRLGKSGVFPGNHVHQVDPGAKSVSFSLCNNWYKVNLSSSEMSKIHRDAKRNFISTDAKLAPQK